MVQRNWCTAGLWDDLSLCSNLAYNNFTVLPFGFFSALPNLQSLYVLGCFLRAVHPHWLAGTCRHFRSQSTTVCAELHATAVEFSAAEYCVADAA